MTGATHALAWGVTGIGVTSIALLGSFIILEGLRVLGGRPPLPDVSDEISEILYLAPSSSFRGAKYARIAYQSLRPHLFPIGIRMAHLCYLILSCAPFWLVGGPSQPKVTRRLVNLALRLFSSVMPVYRISLGKASYSWSALPNVQSEPRAWLARFVLLGAQNVTAMLVGSTALLGSVFP